MKESKIMQGVLDEVIIFGGYPTTRKDALKWMQDNNFSEQATDVTVFGRKSVNLIPFGFGENPALSSNE